MNKLRTKILAGVGLSILALAVCASTSRAESPVSEVILESDSWPGPLGWVGPATIWIDGVKYTGTVLYLHEGGKMNDNSWHGIEIQLFYFDDLGTLEVSGAAKTSFEYVSLEHRWHHYTSHAIITAGTGAFAEAQGVFQFGGYTDWQLENGAPVSAHGWGGATAKIVGIQLPE